jgi:hypothetical protein
MFDLVGIIVVVIGSIIITIAMLLQIFGCKKFDLIQFLTIAPFAMYLLPIIAIVLIELVLFVKSFLGFL